jgi:hypothetical protein
MSMQKICLILFLFGLYTDHGYCAMNEIEPVKITDGLLTKVPQILVATQSWGVFYTPQRYYHSILPSDTLSSLANLMAMNRVEIDFDPIEGAVPHNYFLPTVVKIEDNKLINLGAFCPHKHQEAQEACRQNKALFYPFKQGLILYSYQSSDLDIFETKKKELEDIASKNLKKNFAVSIPVFHEIIFKSNEPTKKDQSTNVVIEEDKGYIDKNLVNDVKEFLANLGIGID